MFKGAPVRLCPEGTAGEHTLIGEPAAFADFMKSLSVAAMIAIPHGLARSANAALATARRHSFDHAPISLCDASLLAEPPTV